MDITDMEMIDTLHYQIHAYGLTLTPYSTLFISYILSYKTHSNINRMTVGANKALINSTYTVVTCLFEQ